MKTDINMFLLNIEHLLRDIRGSRYLHLKKGVLFCGSPGKNRDIYIVKFMAYHLKLIQRHLYLFSTLLEVLMASKSLCVTGGFEFILKRWPEFPPFWK